MKHSDKYIHKTEWYLMAFCSFTVLQDDKLSDWATFIRILHWFMSTWPTTWYLNLTMDRATRFTVSYWTSLKLDLWYFMVPEADLLLCPSADYHIVNKNHPYFYTNWYNGFSYCSSAEFHKLSGLLQYFDIWQLTFETPNPQWCKNQHLIYFNRLQVG